MYRYIDGQLYKRLKNLPIATILKKFNKCTPKYVNKRVFTTVLRKVLKSNEIVRVTFIKANGHFTTRIVRLLDLSVTSHIGAIDLEKPLDNNYININIVTLNNIVRLEDKEAIHYIRC